MNDAADHAPVGDPRLASCVCRQMRLKPSELHIIQPEIPLTLDEPGTWFRSFQVMIAPTIVMVNRNGKIVRRTEGFDATLPEALISTFGK